MNFQELKKQSKVHFIGLGGIGMSALALILRDFNIAVQGSDLRENYLTTKLKEKGINYFVGQKESNIDDNISLIVKTSIIKDDNPEIIAAKSKNIPIITRANLLATIMSNFEGITIAGTHGKTSTTAMTAIMLEFAGLDPTVVNGGVINYFNSNSKIGKGKYLVAESDESDASFVELPTKIGAIANIEAEHLEHAKYDGCFEKQKDFYEQYVKQIPNKEEGGFCAICIDDLEAKNLYLKLKDQKNSLFSYSIKDKNADLFAKNIKSDVQGFSFDAVFKNSKVIKDIRLSAYGIHNVSNSLVAIAIGNFLNASDEKIKESLAKFSGVKRRFSKVGEYRGCAIIDDYAHHPTEIATTLKAAKQVAGNNKVICVFQPHKYTRVNNLFNEFCRSFSDADIVIVAEVYSVSGNIIKGATQDDLIRGIKETGHKNVIKLNSENDLAKIVKPLINEGDLVFCAGAGSITYWAANLARQLEEVGNE